MLGVTAVADEVLLVLLVSVDDEGEHAERNGGQILMRNELLHDEHLVVLHPLGELGAALLEGLGPYLEHVHAEVRLVYDSRCIINILRWMVYFKTC